MLLHALLTCSWKLVPLVASSTSFFAFSISEFSTTPFHTPVPFYMYIEWNCILCSRNATNIIHKSLHHVYCGAYKKSYYLSDTKLQKPTRLKRQNRFSDMDHPGIKVIHALTTSYWQFVPLLPSSTLFRILYIGLLNWTFPYICTIVHVNGMALYSLQ